MPRPLKRTADLRLKVDLYLSAAERELARAKADEAGLPLAAFLRQAILARRLSALPTVSASRWSELARTAANLNQLLRHVNAGLATGIDPKLIEELLAQVQALRRELIGAAQ